LSTLNQVREGAILAEQVSRRFKVSPHRNITLKEAIVRRRVMRAEEIWALRDISLAIEPGESVAFIGRNGSGKTTLLRLIAGIFAPTSGRLQVGGTIGSLLELGAGFHPDFTGRENIFLSGSIYGLKRRVLRERMDEIVAFSELERFIDLPVRTYSAGMYMRLGFAVAVHIEADILLLDEVFAVGDEAFQRKCVEKILEFRGRGGTLCFVSHDASAVERLCERSLLLTQGRLDYDGLTREALSRYHALLAAEEAPAELRAGLREWGTGEVRVADARLVGPDGQEQSRFASGEPLTVLLTLVTERAVPAPRMSLELRDSGGALVGSSQQDLGELGWEGVPGEQRLRFEIDRLPLAEGDFEVGVTLANPEGTRRYHRVDRVAGFGVEPADGIGGLLRVEGRWSLDESGQAVGTT